MHAVAIALAVSFAQAVPPSAAVSVEPRLETLRYRFENPSSYDTAELVPHFFEQTYDTDHVWLGAHARYSLFGLASETHAAWAPRTTAQADDLDTFFQPDGNVVLSGTVGTASLRAWRIGHRVTFARTERVEYGIGYRYRRDTARYDAGTKITRMSLPPLETREIVTTREFVVSHVHEAQWFAKWTPASGVPVSLLLEAAPLAIGRLAIQLPDKYPGRTLIFSARVATATVGASVHHPIGGMDLELVAAAERSFSYSSAATMRLEGLSLLLRLSTR